MTPEELKQLFAEFPREDVSWRAQTLKNDGTAAMALAYIDARDVMDRLDMVCGAECWQDRYEAHGGTTICYLSILVDDNWVTKSDGAGDTAVEAEKGAISDAFKRAAVKWGIGRYLYSLTPPWVPCESYKRNDGKWVWKRWTTDPWTYVKGVAPSFAHQKRELSAVDKDLLDCNSLVAVDQCAVEWGRKMKAELWGDDFRNEVGKKFSARREALNEIANHPLNAG